MKPPSTPALAWRSGRIPAVPCLPARQFDCKAGALQRGQPGQPLWPKSDKSWGLGRSPNQSRGLLPCLLPWLRYHGVRMNENELFQVALGLLPPWKVDRCDFDQTAGRLDIHLDFPRGSVFTCPVCQAAGCKAYDTEELTWRHLNFFQHQAFLHARTPRVDCSQCGIHRVTVPWARPDSGFTLLFEALVLMLAKSMPAN